MPLPLAVTVPAAAAGLAYVNAKAGISYDWRTLSAAYPANLAVVWREYWDRCNVFYRLEQAANKKSTANRPYIRFEDKTWTFAQTYDAALRYGNLLKNKYNVKPKDIVALDLPNSDHFILICFGIWAIGAKPAFINYNLTGEALSHCVKTANAVLMLVDPAVADNVDDTVRQKLDGLWIEQLSPEFISQAFASDSVRPPDDVRAGERAHDMGILIYTSGTTGLPKAAIVSWKKMIGAANVIKGWLGTKPSDVFYTSMPLYHSSAAIMGFYHTMEAECTFAVGRKFSTKTFWKEVRQHKATMIQYVGETLRYLVAAPPEIDPKTGDNLDKKHNVRLAFGNGLRPDVWEKFRQRFGVDTIAEFYGATEGPGATWNLNRNELGRGAIGRSGWIYSALLGRRMIVVARDPETDEPIRDPKTGLCRQVKKGEVGELMFVLPDNVEEGFQGYYNNSKATNSKVFRDVLKKGDAYFRTGDLVSQDSDGCTFFRDRIGDTFRWKSENVATTEVSAVLGNHPAVGEANVYGVQIPNHDGRAGCAALELRQEPSPELLRSIAEHAQRKLPKYAVPIFLRIGKEVSTAVTGTMKQQKHGLRVQGVDPNKVGDDLYWLKDGTYVKFGKVEWDRLNAGQVKL